MRLIVHLGFHKTASTHLQDLLNRNSERLAERGIWYERQDGYPAHHAAAHALMRGDSDPFEAMIVNAMGAGAHTLILSSEDLECVLFNAEVPALIEEVAAGFGIRHIEYHAAIREPGAYFESLYAQLSWHSYADALHMFSEVMKKGVLFMPEPFSGEHATPYWFYCFDYQPFFEAFAASRTLFVHDYADRAPYPGWRMIDRLRATDALVESGAGNANHRLDGMTIANHFCDRIGELLPAGEDRARLREIAYGHVSADQAFLPILARVVGERFADSHQASLRQFGLAEPEQSLAA